MPSPADENAALQKKILDLLAEIRNLRAEVENLEGECALLDFHVEELEAENDVLSQSTLEIDVRGSDEESVYLASNKRKHFHRPNCEWARFINEYALN